MHRVKTVFVAAVAPILLTSFFMVTTTTHVPRATMAITSVLVAHAFFWPAAIVTNRISQYVGVNDARRCTLIMATVSFILWVFLCSLFWTLGAHSSALQVLRESLGTAGGSAASYFFYRAMCAHLTNSSQR